MITIEEIAKDYSSNPSKPLFMVEDTSFILRLLFSERKTKGKDSDLINLKLLDKIAQHSPAINVLTTNVLQELFNSAVPLEPQDLFIFDEKGKATDIKLDIKRFKTRFKYYDESEHKIEFRKFKKRAKWLMNSINEGSVLVLKTKLDDLYYNQVREDLSNHNNEVGVSIKELNNDEIKDLFLSKDPKKVKISNELTKILMKKNTRKDIGEISMGFAILEIMEELGGESKAGFIAAYNGNDDRGFILQTIHQFKENYKTNSWENVKFPSVEKRGLKPENKHNPNSRDYDKELNNSNFGKNIKLSFLTTNGFFKILAKKFAELKNGSYILEKNENDGNGNLDNKIFKTAVKKVMNRTKRALDSKFTALYSKYKDVLVEDITPKKKNETFEYTRKKGGFELFLDKLKEKFPNAVEDISKGHLDERKKYLKDRIKITSVRAAKLTEKLKSI